MNKEKTICTVNISLEDMNALIRIRNYFGENDKTQLEHLAYDVLNRVTKDFSNDFNKFDMDKILNSEHPQFIYNSEKEQVECRCGCKAIWWKTDYLCGSITAYPCKYN